MQNTATNATHRPLQSRKSPEPVKLSYEAAQLVKALRLDKSGVAVLPFISGRSGYPYFLQEWGYEVWNYAQISPITIDDVRAATPRVIAKLDKGFFRVRFDRLTPGEKKYLRAMSQLGPGPHRSGDITSILGIKVQSGAPFRSALIKKGMIYSPSHGDTAFTVPLFHDFMIRVMPEMSQRKSSSISANSSSATFALEYQHPEEQL